MNRKTMILMLVAVMAAASVVAQRKMPAFLEPGDRVAVISPSSTPSAKSLETGCQTLRDWGYEPVVGPHARHNYHGFAGTRQERLNDLLWALRDTTISAIMCTRGGDGAVQLLTHMAPGEFRKHPKWLVGFSDVTALHSAMVRAGVMSIHGPMCHAIGVEQGTDTLSTVFRHLLEGRLPTYELPPHPLNQQGTAVGMLVGGNMSVFCGLAGSDYDFLSTKEDMVLFIEDTDESMTKVDRMLHLLEVRGILQKLKGIIVGQFTSYKHPQNGFDDMNAMLHEYLSEYDIPVCYDFPVGHSRGKNVPLIEGCQVRLTVNDRGTKLEFTPK